MTSITVANIEAKSINTKFGPKNKYVVIDVVGNRYEAGWKALGFPPGSVITGTVTPTKYGNEITGITVLSMGSTPTVGTAAPAPVSAPPTVSSAPVAKGFPLDPTSREISIIRQNALTNAVKTMETLYDGTSLVGMSTEEYTDKILDVARKFADYTSGHDLLNRLASMESEVK